MIVTVEADATPPRVRIDTTAATVVRVEGATRTPVRGTVTDGTIYDYECPQERPVTYDDGLEVSDPVELPNVGDWLVHLAIPELSREVVLREQPAWSQPSNASVVDVPGGPTVAVTFARPNDRGTLGLSTYTREDEDALRALLDDGSVLWLSTHAEVGLGPCYVALGDASWNRRQNYIGDQFRAVTFPYVEINRPAYVAYSTLTIDTLPGTIASLQGTIAGLG